MKTKQKSHRSWLFKEEPSHYSFADLERDVTTMWDGVDNNLARKHLRNVLPGDRVLYYHTGAERSIVGEMRILTLPQVDAARKDPKSVVVQVEAVRRWPRPVSLERIKQDPLLKTWDLVRLPRLSVMPVDDKQWIRLEELAGL
jgi:predicted RNA-binding protein with PUA-like domain